LPRFVRGYNAVTHFLTREGFAAICVGEQA